ncbi:MAGE-domain-containing protein [Gonapodya prolifera JEL478]|uniref:MAGE-domain-containing protein n=1 Tax=Gonapodya prolifera (strain JEL478) TaxID=1344416 RepID=A0A139AS18_GONPJ|nr:MAGE-domain-containing protein [Gonapodya prolifera JEL478]|eukprot:KXS19551.1 MAGE-domain-containing protein [Gonapodya prolifera JEL478]
MSHQQRASPDPPPSDDNEGEEERARQRQRKGKGKAVERRSRRGEEEEEDGQEWDGEEEEAEEERRRSKKKKVKGGDSATQSSQRKFRQQGDDEMQSKVRDLVRLAIFNEHKRVPLKKEDIIKRVFETHEKAFNVVFERAQNTLRDTFGMELVPLPAKQVRSEDDRGKRMKAVTPRAVWMLRSTLEPGKAVDLLQRSDTENITMGVLMVVLALIFVNGGTLAEGDALRHLATLNLTNNIPTMDLSVEKFLEQLAKDGHLDRLQRVEGEKQVVEYKWGPRTKTELDEAGILAFVREVSSTLLS